MPPMLKPSSFDWRAAREDGTRLLAPLQIGEATFHVEAFLVVEIDDEQRAVNIEDDHQLGDLAQAIGICGPWETVEIYPTRHYVVMMTPYCT